MRFRIVHTTELTYAAPVNEHQIELRLLPQDDPFQRVEEATVTVDPETAVGEYLDSFGNRTLTCSLLGPHSRVATTLNAVVETLNDNPFDFIPMAPDEERGWIARRLADEPTLNCYRFHDSPMAPAYAKIAERLDAPVCDPTATILDNGRTAMAWIAKTFRYDTKATHAHSPLVDAIEAGGGVCQDFSHLFLSLVRSWGLPARYVVGYQDPGKIPEREEGQDEPATHAWAEILIPGAGWRGFDPTHNLLVGDHYVAVSRGRDARDAAPQRGSYKGIDPEESLTVSISVELLS